MKVEVDVKKSFESRSCTDIICLALFFAGIGAMFYLTAYCITNGDKRMYMPVAGIVYDDGSADGQYLFCGIDNNVDENNTVIADTDEKYDEERNLVGYEKIYFMDFDSTDMIKGTRRNGFCVNQCP